MAEIGPVNGHSNNGCEVKIMERSGGYRNNASHVFKDSAGQKEEKPLRYTKDSFVKELIGKPMKITLINGSVIQCRLMELGVYDIKVQTMEGQVIIMKSAILTVAVQ